MIFERLKKPPQQKQNEHLLWTSAAYFSSLSEQSNDQINTTLTWDIISFLHEYVGLKDKKIYPYSQQGIMNSYPVRTSQICRNQKEDLKKKNLEVTRANLETKAALTVEAWMDDETVPVGEKLVMISPRGKKSEGYPGLDPENYVFINVYIKIGPTNFQLVQYTSYAREKDLLTLQTLVIKQLSGQPYSPQITLEEGENIQIKSISHQIIDRPITLSSTIQINQIEELIYQDEHNQKKGWVTTRADLPQIDEQLFEEQLQIVLQMLLNNFWILTEQNPVVAITYFDELIKIVREHFLKWVEEHSPNYNKDANFAPYALNLEIILKRWVLAIREKERKLTKEEENKLEKIKEQVKLNPLQPLMRASSVAHCIVGTPQSLAMQMMRMNPGLLSLSSTEFIKLPLSEKRGLLEKINSENMTEIKLENGEVWMVPSSFLGGKGCYVDEYGIAMGPCYIPLEESFAFKMTQQEFALFVSELEQQVLMSEIDEVEEKLEEQVGLASPLSPQIKEKITFIKQMIFKPIVSITELISGDIVSSTIGKSREIRQIIAKLRFANDPLKVCDEIITELISEQNGVLTPSNV